MPCQGQAGRLGDGIGGHPRSLADDPDRIAVNGDIAGHNERVRPRIHAVGNEQFVQVAHAVRRVQTNARNVAQGRRLESRPPTRQCAAVIVG